MALPPQFRRKGPKEAAEPKREERREAKLPPKARMKVEAAEARGGKLPMFKSGGKVRGKC